MKLLESVDYYNAPLAIVVDKIVVIAPRDNGNTTFLKTVIGDILLNEPYEIVKAKLHDL